MSWWVWFLIGFGLGLSSIYLAWIVIAYRWWERS